MLPPTSLRTRALGRVHEHHARIDSTNRRAAELAAQGVPHGAVVTADEQSAGRGRRGRSWFSPAGDNVYASVVLRPGRPGPDLGAIALAVGLGLRDGLATLGIDAGLKWPNDLLVGERKLGGILCEARWSGGAVDIVAGFGINVATEVFPDALAHTATSVHQALAGTSHARPDRSTVLVAVLHALEPVLDRFFVDGFAPLADPYRRACITLGRQVTVGDAKEPAGIAERIDDEGALWIRPTDGGAARRIVFDDVWLAP